MKEDTSRPRKIEMPKKEAPKMNRPTPYICPMHPEVRQDQPGTCPNCGMKLEPERPRPGEAHAPDYMQMLREMRTPWLWTNATVMMLGLWLLSSPFTFVIRNRR